MLKVTVVVLGILVLLAIIAGLFCLLLLGVFPARRGHVYFHPRTHKKEKR